MIASITGILVHKSPQHLIVDVHGIGFQVYTSLQSFYHLPEPKESVMLHTYTHLREDTLELYGFLTPAERETFTLLLSVSGIGPKSALNVLSGLSVTDLIHAIQEGNVQKLKSVPSIGAKTAGRLTLELKDKLTSLHALQGELGERTAVVGRPDRRQERIVEDAVSAFINLGYPRHQVKDVVQEIWDEESGAREGDAPTISLEELVKKTLKLLSR